MLKDDAGFASLGFEFPELEGKKLEHNFPLVGDQMLEVPKFNERSIKIKINLYQEKSS